MDCFELNKKNSRGKADKSRIGGVDSRIKEICGLINSKECYFTTSSCSGRVVLRKEPLSGRKNDSEWLFVSHDKVNFDDLKSRLAKLPKEDVWLVMEAPILHVCCKTIDDAQDLLDLFRNYGFKRSGIMGVKDKIMAEIIGTERMDALVAKNSKSVVSDDYLKLLADEANKKLEKSWNKLEKIKDKLALILQKN